MPGSTVASNSSSISFPDPHCGSQRTPCCSASERTCSTGWDGCTSSPMASPTRSTIRRVGIPAARSHDSPRIATTVVPRAVARGAHDELLGQRHHVGDVGVRLVRLHHRELGVVPAGQPLVAEHPPDLEHAVHAADDEALEVQLEGDPQIQRHVQHVVVGDERASVGAPRVDVQHRCLDLDEAALAERPPEAGDDLVAHVERPPRIGVDGEVDVALAEPRVRVGQTVPLVGERSQRLGEQLEAVDLHRQLARPRRHHRAVHADPVAPVELLHGGEAVVADHRLWTRTAGPRHRARRWLRTRACRCPA